jgi:pimeloyl-ACP methyl ester carboxylesterase
MDQLDLKNAVLVGHSTGGGEVTRYVGRHGTKTCGQGGTHLGNPPGSYQTSSLSQFVKPLVRSGSRMWRHLPTTEESNTIAGCQ